MRREGAEGALRDRGSHRRARRAAERALFRARLPAAAGAARDHRARSHRGAAHGVMVQQPAVAGADRERRGQGAISQGDLCRGRFGRQATTTISRRRANISASISSAAARAAFSSTTRSASPRGDKAAYAKQALENYNFFGAPHVAIIHTDEPLGIYGAIDCGAYVGNFMLAAQALGLGTIPQAALARHSGLIRRHFKLGRRPPRGLRHLVRLRRPRAQGQQLPHLARERGRYRYFRRRIDSQESPDRQCDQGLAVEFRRDRRRRH